MATGLSIPVFIIFSGKDTLPFSLQSFPQVQASTFDEDAIRFHLDAFLQHLRASPQKSNLGKPTEYTNLWISPAKESVHKRSKSQRASSAAGVPEFDHALLNARESELERVIAKALEATNTRVSIDTKMSNNARADIVAWLNDETRTLGEPIIIEIKRTPNESVIDSGVEQVRKYMSAAHLRTGLLVTTTNVDDIEVRWAPSGFVFVLSVRKILDLLRTKALVGQLIASRNRFTHSAG